MIMKIIKYGTGQKPHASLKFTCSYCQSTFVADEFDYQILQKPPEFDTYYSEDDTDYVLPIPGLEDVDTDIIEMLAYSPVATCRCPVCQQMTYKELRHCTSDTLSDLRLCTTHISALLLMVGCMCGLIHTHPVLSAVSIAIWLCHCVAVGNDAEF